MRERSVREQVNERPRCSKTGIRDQRTERSRVSVESWNKDEDIDLRDFQHHILHSWTSCLLAIAPRLSLHNVVASSRGEEPTPAYEWRTGSPHSRIYGVLFTDATELDPWKIRTVQNLIVS